MAKFFFTIVLISLISACSQLPTSKPKIFNFPVSYIEKSYITSKNQTLASIALTNNINLDAMMRANPLYCATCKIANGAWILLPKNDLNMAGDLFYKTQKKDTLGKLAGHFQVSVHSLLKANGLREKDGLRIGQILRIPIGVRDASQYIFPVKNPSLSYGSFFRDFRMRPGLIFPTDEGADIFSISDGKVIFARHLRGLGNVLIIEDKHKRQAVYAYCAKFLTKEGAMVKQGEKIARAGFETKTGANGLYFELRNATEKLSPENYFPALQHP